MIRNIRGTVGARQRSATPGNGYRQILMAVHSGRPRIAAASLDRWRTTASRSQSREVRNAAAEFGAASVEAAQPQASGGPVQLSSSVNPNVGNPPTGQVR